MRGGEREGGKVKGRREGRREARGGGRERLTQVVYPNLVYEY